MLKNRLLFPDSLLSFDNGSKILAQVSGFQKYLICSTKVDISGVVFIYTWDTFLRHLVFLFLLKVGTNRVSIKDKGISVKFQRITRLVNLPAKQNPGWLNSFELNVRETFQDMLSDEDSISLEVYNSLVDEYIKLEEHHNLCFWDIVLVEVIDQVRFLAYLKLLLLIVVVLSFILHCEFEC